MEHQMENSPIKDAAKYNQIQEEMEESGFEAYVSFNGGPSTSQVEGNQEDIVDLNLKRLTEL